MSSGIIAELPISGTDPALWGNHTVLGPCPAPEHDRDIYSYSSNQWDKKAAQTAANVLDGWVTGNPDFTEAKPLAEGRVFDVACYTVGTVVQLEEHLLVCSIRDEPLPDGTRYGDEPKFGMNLGRREGQPLIEWQDGMKIIKSIVWGVVTQTSSRERQLIGVDAVNVTDAGVKPGAAALLSGRFEIGGTQHVDGRGDPMLWKSVGLVVCTTGQEAMELYAEAQPKGPLATFAGKLARSFAS